MTAAEDQKIEIVLFSGGRGTASISEILLKHPRLSLKILVNAYDDGLSTGALRRFIPGMLGPSDIRKNVSRLMSDDDRSSRALNTLIEYRFPDHLDYAAGLLWLKGLSIRTPRFEDPVLKENFYQLNLEKAIQIETQLKPIIAYIEERHAAGDSFVFADCSLGNLLFASIYIEQGHDFNRSIRAFGDLCEIQGEVLNVTDGKNQVLVAVKENGEFLKDEAEIVSRQSENPIKEIFLLEDYPDDAERAELEALNADEIRGRLAPRQIFPGINEQAARAIERANIIIYGPGTQHSSLFPSYLTDGLAEAVAANTTADKIFISNILKDEEIRGETASSLTEKFLLHLNRKGTIALPWESFVTKFFFQTTEDPSALEKGYLGFDRQKFPYPLDAVTETNWENSSGGHSGEQVLDELVAIVNARLQTKLKAFPFLVTIVVPGLNEEKTVGEVLHNLSLLDFGSLGLGKEIIYVDGGSTDRTLEIARAENDVRVYQTKPGEGRGAALSLGIRKAQGNFTVLFPSDGEYDPNDLLKVLPSLMNSDFQAVFGSRTIKCMNVSERILQIYEGNRFLYLISKYGGLSLSFLNLILFNRFVSDVFTGIKAFDARLLKNLDLQSKGLDLETEILAKLGKKGLFILEVPVEYNPRTRREGKKTTVRDGLKALFALIKWRYR